MLYITESTAREYADSLHRSICAHTSSERVTEELLPALRFALVQLRHELVDEVLQHVVLVQVHQVERLLAQRTLEEAGGERAGARATRVARTRRGGGGSSKLEIDRCGHTRTRAVTVGRVSRRLEMAKQTAAAEGMDARADGYRIHEITVAQRAKKQRIDFVHMQRQWLRAAQWIDAQRKRHNKRKICKSTLISI